MQILVAILFFLFGAIIGSFLNVVILRYGTGMPFLTFDSRSKCFSCGKILKWYELIPILSFLFLRGKCSVCKSKISLQYPLVETVTGLLFVGVFFRQFSDLQISNFQFPISNFTEMAFLLLIFSLLIVISVYDLKHKIIPDGLVYSFAALSLLYLVISIYFPGIFTFYYPLSTNHYLDLLAGPILALPFFLLWLVSHGRWIGFGDAKLALGIGWFLGLSLGLSSVVLAFWVGAVVSLLIIGLNKFSTFPPVRSFCLSFGIKNLTMKSEVPFAPFMILATAVTFLFQFDVTGLTNFLQR